MAFIFAFALASTLEAQSAPPAVLFVDVDAGPVAGGPGGLGVPIAIYGTGFGAVRGASTVTVGGVEVASYLSWGSGNAHNPTLDRLVVQPGPGTPSGPIVVTVGGLASNADVTFSAIDAHVWYVSATGSDTNDCRESSPCATISHAVSSTVSGPGDTILVRGADHREGEIWVRREYGHGGEPGRQKVVKPYPGDEVTLSNGARPFIVDADYVTVAGFRFANGKGVGVPDAGDVNRRRGDRFIDNIVAGEVSWSFIDTHGDDHLLAGNVCEATVSSVGTQGHCYYVSYGENTRIRYNVGSGAPGYGLHVFDQRRATLDFPRVIRNVLIEGNILKESKLRSGLILAMADEGGLGNRIDHVVVRNNIIMTNSHLGIVVSGRVHDVEIHNNTIYENGRQGIHVAGDATISDVDIRNNLIVQSENGNCRNDCQWYETAHIETHAAAARVTIDTNGFAPASPTVLGGGDDHAVVGPELFVDPLRFDFKLQTGSAGIDRGVTLPLVERDYRGVRRPQGAAYDLGAFETPTPAVAPSAPQHVRVIVGPS